MRYCECCETILMLAEDSESSQTSETFIYNCLFCLMPKIEVAFRASGGRDGDGHCFGIVRLRLDIKSNARCTSEGHSVGLDKVKCSVE